MEPRSGTDRAVDVRGSIERDVLQISLELGVAFSVELGEGEYPRNELVGVDLRDPAVVLLPVLLTTPPESGFGGEAVLRHEIHAQPGALRGR